MPSKLTRLEYKLRPFLIRFLHPRLSTFLYSSFRKLYFNRLASHLKAPLHIKKKKISFCGLNFRNDLGNAAGFDKDGFLLFFNYYLGAGFAIVGTTLPSAYQGNIHKIYGKKLNPWLPLPHSNSALNSLGLPSLGIDTALNNIKIFRKKIQDSSFPIGLSIAAHPKETRQIQMQNFLSSIEKASPYVDFFEINENCPNIKKDQRSIKDKLLAIVPIMKKIKKPFFIKFQNIDEGMIDFLEKHQFTGLTLTNTQKDYKKYLPLIHEKDKKAFLYYTKHFQGALSGQVITSLSLKLIEKVHQYIKKKNYQLKLIHCGGIKSKDQKEQSRKTTTIRQWYSGLMLSIYEKKLDQIYINQ